MNTSKQDKLVDSTEHINSEADFLHKVKRAVERLPFSVSGDRAFWKSPDGRVFGTFQDQVITSEFLPIQEIGTGDLIGHAVRAVNEEGDEVQLQFDNLDSNTFIASDRLLRALHTLNYFGVSGEPIRLFLDVNQRFFTSIADNHGKAFRLLIESLGLGPEHFVIQVLSNENTDLSTLAFAADNYRRNGFLTGLHAHAPLEANSLIGQIRPDFLSLWLSSKWSLGSLPDLVRAADQFRVRLLARNLGNVSDLYAIKSAGVKLFQVESQATQPWLNIN